MADRTEPTYALQIVKPFWTLLQGYTELPRALREGLVDMPEDMRWPVAQGQRFLTSVVEMTGEPDLGLLAAQQTKVGAFDVLEYVAFSAPTRRAAVETVFRYIRIMNQAADFRIEVAGEQAHLILGSTVPLTRAGIDFQSGAMYLTTVRWFGERATPMEVWLTYPEPADTSQHRATFGPATLRFDAPWNGFVVAAKELELRIEGADPAAHRVLREHLESSLRALSRGDGLIEQVRTELAATLQDGPVSAAALAERMGVSRRTLTRRLARYDTTFTKLLAQVRWQAAKRYLERTDHSIDDVAFLLGFSESSAFVRAFQRWQGMPPAAYRREHRDSN